MAVNLTVALQRISCADWTDYQDIHLWILLMGYCCARDESTELAWFANQIQNIQGWLWDTGLISDFGSVLPALEAFLAGFLYHSTVQRRRITAISGTLDSTYVLDSSVYTPSSSIS